MQSVFDPTPVGGFNQPHSLRTSSDFRGLSRPPDPNTQTTSPPWASHFSGFYTAVSSCLGFYAHRLVYVLLFPQVSQEPPAEDHQAGHWPGGRLHQVGRPIKERISFVSQLWCRDPKVSWGWCETAASHLIVSVCSQEVHCIMLVSDQINRNNSLLGFSTSRVTAMLKLCGEQHKSLSAFMSRAE